MLTSHAWTSPVAAPHEVLVRLRATSVCGTDVHIYNWDQWAQARLALPRILGHEAAGSSRRWGRCPGYRRGGSGLSRNPHSLRALLSMPHGQARRCAGTLKILGVDTDGAFAEYVALPEVDVWKNDPTIPLEFTAIQEPLGNAIDTVLVEDVAGKTVLVTGCGPIGLPGYWHCPRLRGYLYPGVGGEPVAASARRAPWAPPGCSTPWRWISSRLCVRKTKR